MKERARLVSLCVEALRQKGSYDDQHKARLKFEMREVDAKDEHEYFLDLLDRGVKYPENEHNLLIVDLLDIAPGFDISEQPSMDVGEFPDIDVDFLACIRDYLKNEWCPKFYGEENVCNIGSYNSYGLKSALIDMARVHGLDRGEVIGLTKKINLKDEEGKAMTWDKAKLIYKDLAAYCEKYPQVADAASRLVNRNRSRGKHAAGLIISSKRLDDLVPLTVDNAGNITSAWVEGLHSTDLGPMGLIKFDLLIITNIDQVATIVELIKQRHGLNAISALPGSHDFSDTTYLDDEKALSIANDGRLKGIFQFDSQGIRQLVVKGGVRTFDDLVAYGALYRPGPLHMGMHEHYCKRAKGREQYNIHPIMKPILDGTYGVLVYQEQVMQILNKVGDVPLKDCEIVRNAITKKKEEIFGKYKIMFIENGQKNLGWEKEAVVELWNQVLAFSEYGFNKSMTINTLVPYPGGVKEIALFKSGEKVYCVDENGDTVETDVIAVHDHGILDAYEVTFDDGHSVICSENHKFLTEKGQMSLWEICKTRSSIMCDQQYRGNYADEKSGWMESDLRRVFADQESMGESPHRLQELQEVKREGQIEKIEAHCSVWREIYDQDEIGGTSSNLSSVQEIGLENKARWNESNSQVALRERTSNLRGDGTALQRVQGMRNNKEGKHSCSHEEAKQRQRTSRQKKDIFRNSQKNFCTTGNSGSSHRTTSEVENRESREICEMYRGCLEEFQKRVGLEYRKNSLWREAKASRFCERQSLDRGGWLLSFFRAFKQWPKSIPSSNGSTKGSNVERRGDTSRECDVNSHRHDVFQKFKSDEGRLVQIIAGHAPISNIRRLVPRNIVRVCAVGKRRMCDLEVANPAHNFLLLNGVVTSNSHAVAYTYLSSRLLYLKAHWPLEFFAGVLSHETDADKIREYKQDAATFDVRIVPVDINKSGVDFKIHDEEDGSKIYYGLSNLKGMGKDISKRIVESQPYVSLEDFLDRFGTEAQVLKPVIAMRLFESHYDSEYLFQFYEYCKDFFKKREDRRKRYEATQIKLQKEIDAWQKEIDISAVAYEVDEEGGRAEFLEEDVQEAAYAKLLAEKKKTKSALSYESKVAKDVTPVMGSVPCDKIYIDERMREILGSEQEAEQEYYGFRWIHPITLSPDCQGGLTFERFRYIMDVKMVVVAPVEVQVEQVEAKTSKNKKKTKYHQLVVKDENDETARINIWSNEWVTWESVFRQKGVLLRMSLKPPTPPFTTYSLANLGSGRDAWGRRNRNIIKQEDDPRIVVYKPGQVGEVLNFKTNAEVLEYIEGAIVEGK